MVSCSMHQTDSLLYVHEQFELFKVNIDKDYYFVDDENDNDNNTPKNILQLTLVLLKK